MNNAVVDYIVQFIPVLTGIFFVVIVRSVTLTQDKIVLRISERGNYAFTRKGQHHTALYALRSGLPVRLCESVGSESESLIKAIWKSDDESGKSQIWRGYYGSAGNIRSGIFERRANDALITNGVRPQGIGKRASEFVFRKLRFADLARFSTSYLNGDKTDSKLTLFVADEHELLQRLFTFGGGSGVLIQYLAGYSLDIEVA